MTGKLLGSVRVSPNPVRPGEPVLVQALSPTGAVLAAENGITISIDGLESVERWQQYAAAGAYRVHVRATQGDVVEEAVATANVAGEPLTFRRSAGVAAPAEPAMLELRPVLGRPYTVQFRLGDPAARRRPGATGAPPAGPSPAPAAATPGAAALVTALDRQLASPRRPASGSSQAAAAVTGLPGAAGANTYTWDFGDGVIEQTFGPAVSHDYFHALESGPVNQAFVVTCRITPGDLVVRRTIGLQSAYGLCRQQGVIVPHVEPDVHAAKGAGAFAATLTVHNAEDQLLTLTESAVVAAGDDPDAAPPAATFAALAAPIVLPARSATGLAIFVPLDTQPAAGVVANDAPGFTVYYRGQAQDGTPVRFSATFAVPAGQRQAQPYHYAGGVGTAAADAAARREAWPWADVTGSLAPPRPAGAAGAPPGPAAAAQVDRATGTVAVPLGASADAAARARLRGGALAGLQAIAGQSLQTGRVEAAPRPPAAPGPEGAPPAPAVAEGQVCDPNSISAAEAAAAAGLGLSPQLSSHDPEQRVLMPSRFVNALKGDLIISPGGPDVIGVLLRSLNPHQYHNHSGIMTQNYSEITHCTANEDRMADYPVAVLGVPIHVQPSALKYMWPGIITQSIDHAVYGEGWLDEGTQKKYTIVGFSGENVGVGGVITPPLVIKPDVETPAVREKLAAIAETARSMAARVDGQGKIVVKSKGHYRLFGYTDPAIGLTEVAGPEAGWAEGTVPAVCSSFIWLTLNKSGVHLGGQPAASRDGLIAYTAEERRAAAQVLFDNIANSIAEQAGWLGSLAARGLGIAEGIANQVLNTFTGDNPEPAAAATWRSTGACEAVSPDNFRTYLGTAEGGLYGYSEPLVFQEPRWEAYKVFRWTKAGAPGRLTGRVTIAGQPAAGAQVQVYEGLAATSAADGRYTLEGVPGGAYEISARLVRDGIYYEAEAAVTVAGGETTADLALQAPTAAYRLVGVTASFAGSYTELLATKHLDLPIEQYGQPLNPGRVTASQDLSYSYPDGHVATFTVHLTEAADNSVVAAVEGWLYDAAHRGAGAALAHAWSAPFTIAAGGQVATTLSLAASSLLPPWAVNAKLTLLLSNQQALD